MRVSLCTTARHNAAVLTYADEVMDNANRQCLQRNGQRHENQGSHSKVRIKNQDFSRPAMPKNQGYFSTIYVDSKRRHRNAHVTHGSCYDSLTAHCNSCAGQINFSDHTDQNQHFFRIHSQFQDCCKPGIIDFFFHFSGPGEPCK